MKRYLYLNDIGQITIIEQYKIAIINIYKIKVFKYRFKSNLSLPRKFKFTQTSFDCCPLAL